MPASLPCRTTASGALDEIIFKALGAASADGHGGAKHPGVRAWIAHNEQLGRTPHRPMDVAAPLWAKLNEEWRAMQFVVRLVEERGIKPRTASNYWSAVQGWHAKAHGVKIGGGLKLERMPAMLKGLRRLYGDAPRKLRRGISPQMLRKGMDLLLDPTVPAHANMRAALAVAFIGLLRSQEFCEKKGQAVGVEGQDHARRFGRAQRGVGTHHDRAVQEHGALGW